MDPERKFLSTNDLYAKAATLAHSRISFVFVPDEVWIPRIITAIIPTKLTHQLHLILSHQALISRIKGRPGDDLTGIGEFVTVPLLLAAPRLWRWRRRILCFINHNLQAAHAKRADRWAFKLLLTVGFKFGLLESAAGIAELGVKLDSARFLVLPHAIDAVDPDRPSARPAQARMKVGVIGRYRPEKGIDRLLHALVDAKRTGLLDVEMVLGCPEQEARERWSGSDLNVVNTATFALYQDALSACDVVVLNYERDRYFYRSSGVITDAVALGTAVVCPDFPILRQQVTHPVPVGATFDGLDDLVSAIGRALAIAKWDRRNFDRYVEARQLSLIAGLMDQFIQSSAPAA